MMYGNDSHDEDTEAVILSQTCIATYLDDFCHVHTQQWTKFGTTFCNMNHVKFKIVRDFSHSIASFASDILRFGTVHRELLNLVYKVSGVNSVLARHSGKRENTVDI